MLTDQIAQAIERGKVDLNSPYPPDLAGQIGADELTQQAIEAGTDPESILAACNTGMQKIGEKFGRNVVFVPELLMAAKAMSAVMAHLKPFFQAGTVKAKGTFILGTVAGDLHDIGKNLVNMVISGNGWEVIDLGVDVKPAKFLEAIEKHPGCVVGLSALLTTTMANMAKTVTDIKAKFPDTVVVVGGAPLNDKHAVDMGADGYAKDPQAAVAFLDAKCA